MEDCHENITSNDRARTVVSAHKEWRRATHTPIVDRYPSQAQLKVKHDDVAEAAAHMFERFHAVFKTALPYMRACLHVENYLKRDLVRTSAGALEHQNKRAKQTGMFASGWIPSNHAKAAQFSASASVLRAGNAEKVAEVEVLSGEWPLTRHEVKRAREEHSTYPCSSPYMGSEATIINCAGGMHN
jgi:hypothetical protein